MNSQKCGFVALLGAPNAGKSTLLNRMIGSKVSIVSPKVQTTRNRIRGICMEGDTQLVFIDTPGIFQASKRFEKAMVNAAWQGASEADACLLLVDAQKGLCENTREILQALEKSGRTVTLALNKVDKVKKPALLALADSCFKTGLFNQVFMISAKSGEGVEDLKTYFLEQAADGPWMYPEDQLADISERLMAAEITREKLFLRLQQELPYSLTVETEQFETRKDGSIAIHQAITVQREGQKQIVIGKQGQMLKTIGSSARKELEKLWNCRVHLFLFVRVREQWKENPEVYRTLGLEE